MYKTIDCYEFARAFEASDSYKNNFTRPALMALYDYLQEYEDIQGEKYEFDMVALCCEYSEYTTACECAIDHGYNVDTLTDDEPEAKALEWLQDRTQVVMFDGGVIIGQF
jgi:hypothetical protein